MKCPECGKRIKDDSSYCPKCGATLGIAETIIETGVNILMDIFGGLLGDNKGKKK